jgi:hypothetical protein
MCTRFALCSVALQHPGRDGRDRLAFARQFVRDVRGRKNCPSTVESGVARRPVGAEGGASVVAERVADIGESSAAVSAASTP